MGTQIFRLRRVFAAVLLGAPLLLAQGRMEYILNVPPGQVGQAISRYGLTVLNKIPAQEVYLVQGPVGLWPESDDDDDDNIFLEPNRLLRLTELELGTTKLAKSGPAVQRLLTISGSTRFGGVLVWNGYLGQPAFNRIRMGETHRGLSLGAETVAVIDTGIDPNHPVLKPALTPGYDFVRNVAGYPSELDDLTPAVRSILNPFTTAILDSLGIVNPFTTAILDAETALKLAAERVPTGFGHGTMVAGLIRRVAPGARIMPLKTFGPNGQATLYNVIRAVYYAEANGARVINMSLSFTQPSRELERAVGYVSDRQVVCVGSAGNLGREMMAWPAALPRVVGVASTDLQDNRSAFSNFGDNLVRVAAPGEALVTTFPGSRYAVAWGTSFAAPLVSGTVSLMMAVKPQLGWEWADGALSEAAPAPGGLGSGRLDVWRAVSKAIQY